MKGNNHLVAEKNKNYQASSKIINFTESNNVDNKIASIIKENLSQVTQQRSPLIQNDTYLHSEVIL